MSRRPAISDPHPAPGKTQAAEDRWGGLSPEVIEHIASGLRRTGSTIRLDAEVRKRLARHGVPPEAEIIEVEKVFRRIDEMAEPVSATSGSGQGEDRRRPKTTDGYDLIGAELPSTPCAHCGIADGNVLLIRDPRQGMRSTAALHDRCAKPHFDPEHSAPRRKAREKANTGNRRSPHKASPKSRRKAAAKRK